MSIKYSSGFIAFNKAPELYTNRSVMSPDAKRVLTILSPSVPEGLVSTLIFIPISFSANSVTALNPTFSALALSTRSVNSVTSSFDSAFLLSLLPQPDKSPVTNSILKSTAIILFFILSSS